MRFLVPLITLYLALTASAYQYQQSYGELKKEQEFKDYTVRIYRNEEPPKDSDKNPDHQDGLGCFEILRSGEQVYFQKGVIFGLRSGGDEFNTNSPIFMGQSILGNNQPNLVISEINGGNNSLCDYYIFEIGPTFKFITKIKDSGGGEFKDLRGHGDFDLITTDEVTFDYWNCCGAASPHPTVILRYQEGKFRPDLERMKKPEPTEHQLEEWATGFKLKFVDCQKDYEFKSWSAPYEMWDKMLDLIYSGNMDLAWRLCDLSWPANHPGKANFLKEFKKELATSPYYKSIKLMNLENASAPKG